MPQGFAAALGHDLDRQAAVEIGRRRLEIVKCGFLARKQRIDEGVVLRARQRAIDVIGARAAGTNLVVARLKPDDVEIDRVAVHDRRDGVEEGERSFAGQGAQRVGERRRRQRAGGDDDVVPLGRRFENLLAADVDERLAFQRRGDGGGKAVTIDRERAARRQLVGVGGVQHQRAEPAHFGMEEADGAAVRVIGAERVRADELGELPRFMHGSRTHRAHLMQHHGHAATRDLPGSLGTGKAAADHVDGS